MNFVVVLNRGPQREAGKHYTIYVLQYFGKVRNYLEACPCRRLEVVEAGGGKRKTLSRLDLSLSPLE